ncbi:MAG TPA: ATPase, T2SS/T4P/T4SS family [Candidatus Hydrogenedentes bacterium]|nr:ATPase, T2SS/T4P/T4SS family [Candidatus Hydrogenedentota bacterium]
MFDITGKTLKPVTEARSSDEMGRWWNTLAEEGRARKATESRQRSLSSTEIETLARQVYEEVSNRAVEAGVSLPKEFVLRLIGELSGMGPLLELIARADIEDIAINLGHIYVYTTSSGWEHAGPAPDGIGDALRVMIDRAGQRAPTPDYPVADAMLQVMVPLVDGSVRRKGVRINYVMPPASPYGDTITLRVSNYRTATDLQSGSLALLCQTRLPPVPRPRFDPKSFPRGEGILTPEAANYLLGVMVHGGTLVIAGTTGSGKTFVGQRILQEMLDYYPRGAIRLFIVEDSNEIILNGWNGDGKSDTGNIVYTVTRPEIRGGPPPVTMYDLIRAALRSRPHGVVIGEARGAEAWELIRAAATGHGHSAFTIHATSAEHVWPRFLQVVQSHPDAARMSEVQIAQSFAEAVTAAVYIERNHQHGQIVREIVEVSPIVERTAGRPSFSPLFRFEPSRGLVPTGNRPMRPGFRASDLNLSESMFKGVS